MNYPNRCPSPAPGFFSACVGEDRIHVHVRTNDFYTEPPIRRYLWNICALQIIHENAITETRVYSFARYEHLRMLLERSKSQEWETAFEAYTTYATEDHSFAIVHLEKVGPRRGELLIGDDPIDYAEFCPDDVVMATFDPNHGNGLAGEGTGK